MVICWTSNPTYMMRHTLIKSFFLLLKLAAENAANDADCCPLGSFSFTIYNGTDSLCYFCGALDRWSQMSHVDFKKWLCPLSSFLQFPYRSLS